MKHISNLMFGFAIVFLAASAQATFIPENAINYKTLTRGAANFSEQDFNLALRQIQDVYAPVVTGVGGNLSIQGEWRSEEINAGAAQSGGKWMVKVFGGLARRPELTIDALTQIVCHELGHHLGGFPYGERGGFSPGPQWMASEGQADYFSTQVCARKLWEKDIEKNAEFKDKVSATAQKSCDTIWSTADEKNLCYRIAVATESVMTTMSSLMNVANPKFDTPDQKLVSQTIVKGYPEVQCRMDTLMQGSLCLSAFDEKIVPGKNLSGGPKGTEAETQAAHSSCTQLSGFSAGLRPACWFKARM